ncbi:hypothetical protein ScPMuIL_017046 [Solemya velum]
MKLLVVLCVGAMLFACLHSTVAYTGKRKKCAQKYWSCVEACSDSFFIEKRCLDMCHPVYVNCMAKPDR